MKEYLDFPLTPDHPVFTVLSQENPDLFTTAGLSGLLRDCALIKRKSFRTQITHLSLKNEAVYLALAGIDVNDKISLETLNKIVSDPFDWVSDASPHIQKEMNFYSQCGGFFGTDFAKDIFLYHAIRSNIQQLQRHLGISGLITKSIAVRDRLFSYLVRDDQLLAIDSDYPLLEATASRVINFFLEVTAIAPAYNLFIDFDNSYYSCSRLCHPRSFLSVAAQAQIYTESINWVKNGDIWRGEITRKLDPDKIRLSINLNDELQQGIDYVAEHADDSRFPWKQEKDDFGANYSSY